MRIHSLATALPDHYYDQEQLLAGLSEHWGKRFFNTERLADFFRNVQVGGRHLAVPIEEYEKLDSFGKNSEAYLRVATQLGTRAVGELLAGADLHPDGVDAFFFTTVTGVAVPSIDARVVNALRLNRSVRRVPLFGLGCLAGAAGIARAADYLAGHPTHAAVLLSVELCSLTLQRNDLSVPNIVSSGLFGDGGAAVLLVGSEHPLAASAIGPRVVDSRSSFYYDTERVMGWDMVDTGFKIVLSPDVPRIAEQHLRGETDEFLAEHDLELADISHVICHPGGPKVLEAIERAFGFSDGELAGSWKTLQELGNMSSTSVLFVMAELLGAKPGPAPGQHGLLMAMGPGFCSEAVLLQW